MLLSRDSGASMGEVDQKVAEDHHEHHRPANGAVTHCKAAENMV